MFGIGFISTFAFQSPRSGQICSNVKDEIGYGDAYRVFQSPRSGQICSNSKISLDVEIKSGAVSIP